MEDNIYTYYNSITDESGEFTNLAVFCKQNNLNESCSRDVVNGRQKQHRGYYFKKTNHDIDLKEVFVKHTTRRPAKLAKTKQERYNQSNEWCDFITNCKFYYNQYHINQKLNCKEIGKKFGVSDERVRLEFKKNSLPVSKYTRLPSGNEHYSFKTLNSKQQNFLNNFKHMFEKHHLVEKLSVYEIAKKYNMCKTTIFNYARRYNCEYGRLNVSAPHQDIVRFLEDNNINYIINDRQRIKPKELDIFIPVKNIGIEINGVYWHGETKIGKYYHQDKHNLCEKNNTRLLQFFDDEILNTPELCFSILRNILGLSNQKVYARQTEIRHITSFESSEFLKNNHIQGNRPASIRLGLFKGNELISVMTFSKDKKYQYQLLRYCTLKNVKCIGGASKLFTAFIQQYKPNQTVSYCDKRLFNGKLYTILGFKQKQDSPPNYYYFKINQAIRESRIKYQKHKLKNVLKIYDSKKTEWENMQSNSYDRVWDCGNKVFVWETS